MKKLIIENGRPVNMKFENGVLSNFKFESGELADTLFDYLLCDFFNPAEVQDAQDECKEILDKAGIDTNRNNYEEFTMPVTRKTHFMHKESGKLY